MFWGLYFITFHYYVFISYVLSISRLFRRWSSALAGHGELNPFVQGEVQKSLMLERFGEENPGFDFSGADFSGSVPDPRNFMGGVKYN